MAPPLQTDPMQEFVSALPKAELHVHLEGSVDADTLWELATRQQSTLAAQGRAAVDALYATTDFAGFIEAFKTVCLHLRTPADYEFVSYQVLRRLAAQNVRYVEMNFSAGVVLWKKQNIAAVFAGAEAGARQAQRELGIRTQWIFDAVRQFPIEQAWQVARAAADLQNRGVIGLGIGGDEAAGPAERFREIYRFARAEGLLLTAHAGETVGPESIWSALNDLGVERIGHGLTAAQDPKLVRHLAERRIPVEICLTSNLRTGGVKELGQHPLRRYFDQGVPVSLHSDDPALFGTDLNREYLLAHEVFGFSRDELRRLAMNSFEAAFLPPEEKQPYLAAFAERAHLLPYTEKR
jgi:adenosine deaminase/aminodeoxyfutalosine deaminase